MTISISEMALYAFALLILFLTPGPVWVALIARALSGGFHAAWPLALGVVVGDVLWPVLAIFGIAWITSVFAGFMVFLKWVAVAIFWLMGIGLIRNAGHMLGSDSRLTKPGMWAGFAAGVAVILANPKAILFYMGVLPGFFDVTALTGWDIAMIAFLSLIVPLVGNIILAYCVDRARRLVQSPQALKRINIISGWLLIAVGCAIAIS